MALIETPISLNAISWLWRYSIQGRLTVAEFPALLIRLSSQVMAENRAEHRTREENLQRQKLFIWVLLSPGGIFSLTRPSAHRGVDRFCPMSD